MLPELDCWVKSYVLWKTVYFFFVKSFPGHSQTNFCLFKYESRIWVPDDDVELFFSIYSKNFGLYKLICLKVRVLKENFEPKL